MKIVSKVEVTHTHTHISVPSFQVVKLAVKLNKETEPTCMPHTYIHDWHAICNLFNTSVNMHPLGYKKRSVNIQGNMMCSQEEEFLSAKPGSIHSNW